MVLLGKNKVAGRKPRQRSRNQRHAGGREFVFDIKCGIARSDRHAFHVCDRACVELADDAHERHAGLALAVGYRRLDRRSTAILRQKRRMQIQGSKPRRSNEVLIQDMPVSHDERHIGLECGELRTHVVGDFFRLINRQPAGERPGLDFVGGDLLPSTHRAVWLCEHRDDPGDRTPFAHQPVEQREGDGIGAQEDEVQHLTIGRRYLTSAS